MSDLFNELDVRVSRVSLTATLPQHAEKELQTMNIDASTRRKVVASSGRANIYFRVITMNCEHHVEIIKNLLMKQQDRRQKILLNVLTKIEGQHLARDLKLPFYEADLDDTDKTKMMEFMSENLTSMIATTAIGTGIDLTGVSLIALILGGHGLTTITQQS